MQQLYRYILLSFVLGSVSAFGQSEAIVVDEEQAEFKGQWQSITEKGSVKGHFRFAMNYEGAEPSSTATFRPNVPVTGKYHVEVAASGGGNRSSKVPCVISFADGQMSVLMDQTKKPGGWQRIAENVQFNAGTGGSIVIGNNGGAVPGAGKVVIADAVRLVPTGESEKGCQLVTSADAGGTILLNPKKKTFDLNAVATLTAQADDGYVFSGWSGDASGLENPLSLTMDKSKRVSAGFVQAPAGAILDASDAAFTGSWQAGAPKWGARTNYQFASTCNNEANASLKATALYRPQLSKAGLYDIYIWYSKGPNRSDSAPWEIVGKNKTVNVNVNQQVRGGDWLSIANAVEFDQGTNGYVKVSNVTGADKFVVVADSVAFVYVGKP